MQLPEASFVPFLRWSLRADGLSLPKEDCWGEGTQGIFRLNHPASLRGTRWEWVSSTGNHWQPAEPTEQEVAQTLLGLVESRGLGEKQASAARLRKLTLVVWFPLRADLSFPGCCSKKVVFQVFLRRSLNHDSTS